ncbi:MAG: hypothetical protein OXU23_10090 [Candidatus Poribacteria bacterium]|nr:hypothetical protein [Candidatus Poribacteria bacterium]
MGTAIDIVLALSMTIATIVLVRITHKYVLLTQQILKTTNKPKVVAYLSYEPSRHHIYLNIQNIGVGYASNIKFDGDLSFTPMKLYFMEEEPKALKYTEPFKNGQKFLGVGQKISVILADSHLIANLEKQTLSIQISYSDSANEIFKEELIKFDLRTPNISNQSQYTDDMTNELKNISRQLESINQGIRVKTRMAHKENLLATISQKKYKN